MRVAGAITGKSDQDGEPARIDFMIEDDSIDPIESLLQIALDDRKRYIGSRRYNHDRNIRLCELDEEQERNETRQNDDGLVSSIETQATRVERAGTKFRTWQPKPLPIDDLGPSGRCSSSAYK